MAGLTLREDYWETFALDDEDIEFLYSHLLETETPTPPEELTWVLIQARVERERRRWQQQQSEGMAIYLPKNTYTVGQKLVFPALEWRQGEVIHVRPGRNPDLGEFQVIEVVFDDGETRAFAAGLEDHSLNQPPEVAPDDPMLSVDQVVATYGQMLVERVEKGLREHPDFVRIAGRWFPRALLVDVNVGHLNLAEAVLDMMGGGPLPTSELIPQIDLPADSNPKLVEFSLDLALQEDERFDEVGPAGKVIWFLRRLEPPEVLEVPIQLRYSPVDYDRSVLTKDMLRLEAELSDELSQLSPPEKPMDQVVVTLTYPHWRVGSLPLSSAVRSLFPTAYEAPRIRFMLVDGRSGKEFPGWVVREERYVFGLREWYKEHDLMPGNQVIVRRGEHPGEVIVDVDRSRGGREWVRTVLVGTDGGMVFAMLKHKVAAAFDDRMLLAVPDPEPIDEIWQRYTDSPPPFEKVVVDTLRELAKLNPQSHVHATELYAAVNVVRRSPPGPILALLVSRPWFEHIGDLYFRLNDAVRV